METASNSLTLVRWRGPLGPKRPPETVAYRSGAPLWDYIPDDFRAADVVDVRVNGKPVDDAGLYSIRPEPGDSISLRPIAGAASLIGAGVMLVVGVLLRVGEYHMNQHQKKRARQTKKHTELGTFTFDVMGNSIQDGAPQPVVMGQHRTGGVMVQEFTRGITQDNREKDVLYALLNVSEGPIERVANGTYVDQNSSAGTATLYVADPSIAEAGDTIRISANAAPQRAAEIHTVSVVNADSFTITPNLAYLHTAADADDVLNNTESGCHLDGNDLSNYASATLITRRGTLSQATIPGFTETVATTAMNTQLLSTADQTLTGTTASDRWVVKLTFISGLYYLDGDGHPHSSEFQVKIRYRTTAGPGAWSGWETYTYQRRRADAFSIYPAGTFPSKDTYDLQLHRTTADHGTQDGKVYADAYIKEYQEIAYDDLKHPCTALAGIKAISTDALSGTRPAITVNPKGVLLPIQTSATAFTTAAWTNNPSECALGLIYNRRWGLLCEVDPGIELTMSSTALDYTAGETVTGAAADLQFIGIVESWDSTTRKLIVEVQQGLPYGNLTGGTSGKVAAVSSVDESYAVDLSKAWTWNQFCDGWVPDGSTQTFVDANSTSGTATLYVDDPSIAVAGDHIRIDCDGDRDETVIVQSVGADHFVLTTNLTYTHTLAQADPVSRCEVRCQFDYVFGNGEDGWNALARIARAGRCIPVQYGSYISFVILKSETPSGLISEGSILLDEQGKSSLKLTFPEITTRANRMALSFRDRDAEWTERTVAIEDPLAQTLSEKPFTIEDELFGVTRESQVRRDGGMWLKRIRYCSDPIQFRLGLDAIDFEVGDVRYLGHAFPEYGLGGGRVVSATASTITIDQPITVTGGEAIRIRFDDGTEEAKTLAATAGTLKTLSITTTWATTPSCGDLFAIGDCQQVRITAIRPTQDLKFEIECEPDSSAYYIDDWGELPEWTEDLIPDQKKIPSDVTGVTATGRAIVNRDIGAIRRTIDVGFEKPTTISYSHSEVWLKSTSAEVLRAGRADRRGGSAAGEFHYPCGIACDGTYVYVADHLNHVIRKHNAIDLAHVADLGSEGTGDGELKYPTGVCCDGAGNIFIVDHGNHRLQKWTDAGVYVDKLGSEGSGDDQFEYPWAIAYGTVGGNGFVFVCDTWNDRIVKIDDDLTGKTGGTWTTIGTTGSGNDQFDKPQGIACDNANVYVGDTRNDRIHKRLATDLSYVAKLGSTGTGTNQFTYPTGICVDSTPAEIWVADQGNGRLVRLSTALVWAEASGSPGFGRMQFGGLHGLAWYDDYVYATEQTNHQIQVRHDDEGASSASFEYVGIAAANSYTIENVRLADKYTVAVAAVSIWNSRKDPEDAPSDDITITEFRGQPPNVTGLTAASYGYGTSWIRVTWNAVVHPESVDYEVRRGRSWQVGTLLGRTGPTSWIDQAPPSGVAKYWVAALTRSTPTLYSATPASVQIQTTAPTPQLPMQSSWDERT